MDGILPGLVKCIMCPIGRAAPRDHLIFGPLAWDLNISMDLLVETAINGAPHYLKIRLRSNRILAIPIIFLTKILQTRQLATFAGIIRYLHSDRSLCITVPVP